MKTKSKYILLLFVSMIVLLFGGFFLAAQQEKEGPITAEAASEYWINPTTCPECGESAPNPSLGSLTFERQDGCTFYYLHSFNRGASRHSGTISVHTSRPNTKRWPSCTTNGYETYYDCMYCHTLAPGSSYIEIPALGHDWGDWFVTQAPTCTRDGTQQRECQRNGCSERETAPVVAPGHSFTNYVSDNNATCTEDGTETAKCEICEVTDTRTDEGSALGHDIEYHAGKEPTCTAIGWNAYETCSRCDYTTYQEIAATGHTPGAAATCTTPQTCTECGTTLAEATGHTWDSGTISKITLFTAHASNRRVPLRGALRDMNADGARPRLALQYRH